jgi:signal transduction histidine kinase
LTRLGGRSLFAFLRDLTTDVLGLLVDGVRRLLHPRSAAMREDLLARALVLLLLAAFGLLLRDLSRSETPLLAVVPAALALAFAGAGGWGWGSWRARSLGRAHLLVGGLGGVAALTLGRLWLGGVPGRGWILIWFLVPPAIVEATLLAGRGEGGRSLAPSLRGILYGVPLLGAVLLPRVPIALDPAVRDAVAAAAVWAAGLGLAFGIALISLKARRAIDARQRGKLMAAGSGTALLSLLAGGLVVDGGDILRGAPLLGLAAAPWGLTVATVRHDLLWVDRFLRGACLAAVAAPLAVAAAWAAVRTGGPTGTVLAAILVLLTPLAWTYFREGFDRVVRREARRRARALQFLEDRFSRVMTLTEVSATVRGAFSEAFPGVEVSLLAADPAAEGLREVAPEEGRPPRPPLHPDQLLFRHLSAETDPITRYEVLSAPRFAPNRAAWLRELDDLRGAALIPCREGGALRGVVLLGGQVRGGFFTEDEMREARRGAAPVGAALLRSLELGGAEARIAALEAALREARGEVARFHEEEVRAMANLDASSRHIMKAYDALKTRGLETKETRGRTAGSAAVILAGRVAARVAPRIAGALREEKESGQPGKERGRGPKAGRAGTRRREALLAAEVIEVLAHNDPEMPSDVHRAVEAAVAIVRDGWRERITLDAKIGELPAVAWPRGALQAALLHLLLNAEEAIEKRGTITIGARTIPGRTMTVAEAEAAGPGVPLSHTEGQRAWVSGAPRVEITVSDDGVGISADDQPRLFTPFFTTKPPRPGGLGLGLSVVADALARHGGSIRVDSEPGEGSSLILELPGVARPAPARRKGRGR